MSEFHPGAEMYADTPPPPPCEAGSGAVVFIMLTLMLDVMSFGLIVPVWPSLIRSFSLPTADAGWWVGLAGTTWALMQLCFQPVVGALSDRYGRRPVVLASNLGNGLDFVLMALSPSIWWLLAGRIISGITASSTGTAYAYIADVTPQEKRASAFGMLGAVFAVGFILGPGVGGMLGDPSSAIPVPFTRWVIHGSERLPFWVAAVLCLLNSVFVYFAVPESLPKSRRAPFHWARANPIASLQLLRSHPDLLPLAWVQFLAQFANTALMTVFILYAGDQFGWKSGVIGYTIVGIALCAAVVQGGLTGYVVRWAGERNAILIGLACGAVGFCVFGLAPGWRVFLVGVPVMSFWGMAAPATQSIMSHRVDESEQGQLQGANMGVASLAGMFGPITFGGAYAVFTGRLKDLHLPGAPFLGAGGVLVLALLTALWGGRDAGRREAAE
jgi:DHA1 family tetracycline resistance protein-like MFS transporter